MDALARGRFYGRLFDCICQGKECQPHSRVFVGRRADIRSVRGKRCHPRQGAVALLAKQARLQGLMVGSRRQQQDYVAALEQSGVRPVLDRTFSLNRLAEAFSHQASGVHFGKVVVEW